EAVKGTTPLTVSIDPAREHRITVRLEGHAPQEVRVAAGAAAAPVRLTLDAAGPLGRIAVSAPYPLDVVWRGKVLSHGQPSPEVQARGLLEDGRTYRREGKLKQALDNFQTIVSGFPNTSFVDDALLEIGRYYLEVDHDAAKARDAFEQVTKRFPQSDGAPGAYYYLGRLTMDKGGTAADLDDALAQFARVQRLYPRSEWVPRALYATALAHRKSGKLAEATDDARRVALEHP